MRFLVLDLRTGKLLHTLKDGGQDDLMRESQFTKDGKFLAVRQVVRTSRTGKVTQIGQATVWDWRTGKQVTENLPKVFEEVDPNISPDGRYELQLFPYGIEVIDRAVTPPAIMSHSQKP